MDSDRLSDGVRIAQLLASEISGNEGRLRDLALADADRDVEPTTDGALAYRVVRDAGETSDGEDAGDDRETRDDEATRDPEAVAEVYVQPDRVRIEFLTAVDAAADAAADTTLRVRPKAVRPPRTLVFVEDGAHVKRVLPVFAAVVDEP
ncbi:hypothetical protein [Halorubrum laminariae]|uniref:DUF7993 domain-containing protein n=1 Tax=Halorubrum laminariae TaxID=1433523 RepID=A0ABD6BYY0_9EURY|nr:hypothetical protein [Halorubrum laminariae]